MSEWPSYLGKNNRKPASYSRTNRGLNWGLIIVLLVNLALWVGGIYVAVHFIKKFW